MFSQIQFQECVRAYPHAASAWSMLGVALSDSFHAASKRPKISTVSLQDTNSITGRSSKLLHADEHRLNSDSSLASETASCNATLMTMRNVALATCTTGSCISALASVANRRQSIPLEQLHNTSPPPRLPPHCARSVGYNAENMHQIADTYRAQSRCAFDDDAPVTIV
uniref:Uncharacterized protein n=1 Tax=Ascaris lumbricoides TaxID=6252 RepID=A0A0M3IJX5_ASCLU